MGRPYTGWDGDAKGRRPGTEKLIQLIAQHTGKALWNNGSWGVRTKRGKSSPSVHGTGRAFDMSWRKMENRGSGRYDDAHRVMEFLTRPDVADALGIEAVFDYWNHYGPHGRGYKCDRGAWQVYDKKAFSGVPGDWIHVELSPALADDPNAVNHFFLHFWNLYEGGAAPAAPAPASAPAPAPAPAPKPAAKVEVVSTSWSGRSMRKGSRGDRVKVVQKALNDAGFPCGKADGKYGPVTEGAVKAFQQAHPECGPVDGIVGKMTWAVLVG